MIAPIWVASGLLAACPLPDQEHAVIQAAIDANAIRFDIPARWIASVIAVESGDRTCRNGHAIRSRAGAEGVMQLMKPTWIEMQHLVGTGSSIDDPVANITAGTAYLRMMYDRFGYPGLFAAYNAGPQRYGQSLTGRPLPGETQRYLTKILERLEGVVTSSAATASINQIALFVVRSATQNSDRDGPDVEQDRLDGALFFLKR